MEIKKYNVQKGIVDLKPTQEELLKILKKLDNTLESNNFEGKKECIDKSYADIFSELDPIANYMKELKKNKYVDVENTFLSRADLVTRIINGVTDEPLNITYSNNIHVTPAVKLKNISFDDRDLDSSIIDRGNASIKKNNLNTPTITFKDNSLTDDGILKKTYVSITENNSKTPTITFRDSSLTDEGILKKTYDSISRNNTKNFNIKFSNFDFGDDLIKSATSRINENNERTLTVNLSNKSLLDTSLIDLQNKELQKQETVKLPKFVDDPYFNSNPSRKGVDIDRQISDIQTFVGSQKELLTEETEDLTQFGDEMTELDEAIVIINKLIETISNVLNSQKIESIVNEYVKFVATSTFVHPKIIKFDSKSIEIQLPEIVKIFDINSAKIKDINISLDNDPILELQGGNFEAYFRKLFTPKKNKNVMMRQIKDKILKLKNDINRFNVLFIQYNYYLNFIIKKIKLIKSLENYDVKIFLSLKDINDILEILTKKYKIITNPEEIFKEDINSASKQKLKILYFKHYYFIYMLYNLFTSIKNKAVKNGFSLNEDFSVNLVDEKLITGDIKIELIKYFTIFNLYSDLIKD
jgi:hypothetical protein